MEICESDDIMTGTSNRHNNQMSDYQKFTKHSKYVVKVEISESTGDNASCTSVLDTRFYEMGRRLLPA